MYTSTTANELMNSDRTLDVIKHGKLWILLNDVLCCMMVKLHCCVQWYQAGFICGPASKVDLVICIQKTLNARTFKQP